jgi:methylglyoxal synthase/pSer/pThr/pTyr-binding forkhead associated (FHA) protein
MKIKICYAATLVEIKEFDLAAAIRVQGECIVGRSPDVGLILDSEDVSRQHGKFFMRDGKYCFCDLGSSNGSVIDDRIVEANQPHVLTNGDAVHIGDFVLLVEEPQQELAQTVVKVIDPWMFKPKPPEIVVSNPAIEVPLSQPVANTLEVNALEKINILTPAVDDGIGEENIDTPIPSQTVDPLSSTVDDTPPSFNAEVVPFDPASATIVQAGSLSSSVESVDSQSQTALETDNISNVNLELEPLAFDPSTQTLVQRGYQITPPIESAISTDLPATTATDEVDPSPSVVENLAVESVEHPIAELTENPPATSIDRVGDEEISLDLDTEREFEIIPPQNDLDRDPITDELDSEPIETTSTRDRDIRSTEELILDNDEEDIAPVVDRSDPAIVAVDPTSATDLQSEAGEEISFDDLEPEPDNLPVETDTSPTVENIIQPEDAESSIEQLERVDLAIDTTETPTAIEETQAGDTTETSAASEEIQAGDTTETPTAIKETQAEDITETPTAIEETQAVDEGIAVDSEIEDKIPSVSEESLLVGGVAIAAAGNLERDDESIHSPVTEEETMPLETSSPTDTIRQDAINSLSTKQIIALCHDSNTQELIEFIDANKNFFAKCLVVSWLSINQELKQQTGIDLRRAIPSGMSGGYQQIAAAINAGDVAAVIFLRDFLQPQTGQTNEESLLRLCNINQILLATNAATAQAIVSYLS